MSTPTGPRPGPKPEKSKFTYTFGFDWSQVRKNAYESLTILNSAGASLFRKKPNDP